MAFGRSLVGEFPSGFAASLAQGYLEREGIQSYVSGAIAQSWAGGDVPLTGVRLEVATEDLKRAREILDSVEGAGRGLVEAFEDDEELALEAQQAATEEGAEVEPTSDADDVAPDQATEFRARERLEVALRLGQRGIALSILSLFFAMPLLAALALVTFFDLVKRDRWRALPWIHTCLAAVCALACLGTVALAFVRLHEGERWWWLTAWL